MSTGASARWPAGAVALRGELEAAPGRIALLVGGVMADQAAIELAQAWNTSAVSAGRVLTTTDSPPTAAGIGQSLAASSILVDLELVFWEEFPLDPLALFRQLGRSAPRVCLWPGEITARIASFSRIGRPDRYEARLSDTIVLRARAATFPDEVPYEIERIP